MGSSLSDAIGTSPYQKRCLSRDSGSRITRGRLRAQGVADMEIYRGRDEISRIRVHHGGIHACMPVWLVHAEHGKHLSLQCQDQSATVQVMLTVSQAS